MHTHIPHKQSHKETNVKKIKKEAGCRMQWFAFISKSAWRNNLIAYYWQEGYL